jgi:uncharacterized protein (DUF427 family)
MERRTVLGYAVVVLTAFGGCVWDQSNDSRMSFSSTEIACSNKTVDINYDDRDLATTKRDTLNAIVESDQYTVTAPYPRGAENLEEELEATGERTIIQYKGTCYEINHHEVFDD